jgi:hypothetical protein
MHGVIETTYAQKKYTHNIIFMLNKSRRVIKISYVRHKNIVLNTYQYMYVYNLQCVAYYNIYIYIYS